MKTPLQLAGRDEERLTAGRMSVGPDFFETHGLEPVYGRSFDPRDHLPVDPSRPRPGTVIVNQAFSDRFFDGKEMLGHELRLPNLKSDVPEGRFTVVGVFPNFGFVPPGEGPPPMVYLPLNQYFSGRPMLQTTVQVQGPPAARIGDLRKAAEAAHPKLSVVDAGTYERQLSVDLHAERLHAAMVSLFSLFGLSLACLGIFSAMTCAVSYRQREMGIRMAVGATGSDIGRLMIGETLRLVTCGIVLGITFALMAGRLLNSFLYGITAYDPWTFLTVPLGLTAVATTAGWWPAQRAAGVDPNISLRSE